MRIKNTKRIIYLTLMCLASCASCARAESPATEQAPPPKPAHTPREQAKEALRSGDTKAATRYALQMLNENTDRKCWGYGNVIHEANQVLGMAALQEERLADAKKYLIAAGKTPGSPQLNSFGPPMALAQQLLEKGERSTVIQYLDLVARFWAYTPPEKLKEYEKKKPGSAALIQRMNQEHQKQLDDWKRQIRAGKKPKLNDSNSLY